jgi:hypothetical protein
MNTSRRTLVVLTLLVAASLGDVATTIYGIETHQLYEANPFVAQLLDAGGYGLFVIAKATAASLVFVLYAAVRTFTADGWELTGYAPVAVWIGLHAAVTAHNGMLLLAA